MTKRQMKPREPIAPHALSVSQLTTLALLGIDPRRYLDLLAAHSVPHARVGKLRVALLDDVRATIRRISESSDDTPEAECERQPETADEVLSKLGLRRSA